MTIGKTIIRRLKRFAAQMEKRKHMDVKQIILMRRDLHMRRGKEIAQGAHASMAWLSHRVRNGELLSDVQKEWLADKFTKVCLQVHSEEELLGLAAAAEKAGLESHVIQDCGHTEFNGVPTYTAAAIGPDLAQLIDPITGHLKLY